ncbi:MAG: hypothetical protein J0647_00440, partial [Campylobacteraceae bacterium]|nr:hypothetical protein [Campylobacteraceae bacterium]
KPGFIFKFKNFSWIDYALHSGTPNKKVLIKTKSGKEIETSIVINEIYLTKDINGASECFCIELTNNPLKNEVKSFAQTSPSLENSEKITVFTMPDETLFIEDLPPKENMDFGEEPIHYGTDYDVQDTIIEPIKENASPLDADLTFLDKQESSSFKLKFDNDILLTEKEVQNPILVQSEYSSIDEIKIDDLDFETHEESYPEDKHEDLLRDTNLLVENMSMQIKEEAEECFDLSLSAESLGLDLDLIAQIISEYIDEMDNKMLQIKQSIEEGTYKINNVKDEILKLKSVAQNLRITSLLRPFEYLEKSLEFDSKEEIFHALENVNQSIIKFKENLQ